MRSAGLLRLLLRLGGVERRDERLVFDAIAVQQIAPALLAMKVPVCQFQPQSSRWKRPASTAPVELTLI